MRGKELKIIGAIVGVALMMMMIGGNGATAAPPGPSPTPGQTNPQPANKTAAIGNTVDDVTSANGGHVVLSEQLKVSSPADFIINLSAECAIVTQLVTGDGPDTDTDEAHASGQVAMWITIDGKRVPVAGDPNGNTGDDGTVVFCNHARGRQVVDKETAPDGQDRIADYLSARQANAFQWLATNVGFAYDSPTNGNNIVDVDVHAIYDDQEGAGTDCSTLAKQDPTTTYGETCSKAFVGKRTLIVEYTKASVIENTANSTGGQ